MFIASNQPFTMDSLAIFRLFDYSIYMQIVGASFPPVVNVPGLQRRASSAGLQPTPETGRAPPALRPGRTLTSAIAVVPEPTIPQSGASLAAIQRQRFEFGLRIVTGAFSRLVVDVLGLTPSAPPPLVTEKPALNNRPESVSPVINLSAPHTPIAAPIPVEAPPPANHPVAEEAASQALPQLTPAIIGTPFEIHPEKAQAAAVNPTTLAQAPPVTSVPAIVAAVGEVTHSASLQQHEERGLDIFDSRFGARGHTTHPHTVTGTRLDRTA